MEPGYLRIEPEQLTEGLRGMMTVYYGEGEWLRLYKETEEGVYVPRTFWTRFEQEPEVSLGADNEVFKEDDPIGLRQDQAPAAEAVCQVLAKKWGTILVAPCGTGKTVMALEVIRRFALPTLVIVHKTFLVDQWTERAKEFLPNAKVGIWRQDRCDSGKDHDLVIAFVQTLTSKREYPPEVYKSFGMVVTDEVHRFAAPIWQKAIVKFPAKYRLGLTATPDRRDGLQGVFLAHIGSIGFTLKDTRLTGLRVYRVNLSTTLDPKVYTFPYNGKINFAKLTTLLASSESRTKHLVHYIVRAVKADRTVLVLTERLKQVAAIMQGVKEDAPSGKRVAKFVGGMTKEQQAVATKADVIVATYQIAQEGLDIPRLDTVFLATPKTNIVQSVGRILRPSCDKQLPVVMDFVDEKIPVLQGFWFARVKRYKSIGAKVGGSKG